MFHRDGEVLEVLNGPRRGVNPNVMEMEALFAAVNYASALFPGASVRAWTDSQAVISKLLGRGRASKRKYFSRLFEASARLTGLVVEWVPRRFVAEANCLARAAAMGEDLPEILKVAKTVGTRLRERN